MNYTNRMVLLGVVLMGFAIGGVGCGGSKSDDAGSSGPVAKPNPNSAAPVPAGKAMSEGGATKLDEEGGTVQKK